MPVDCTFCNVGVSTVCADPDCNNHICPAHTDEDGRCWGVHERISEAAPGAQDEEAQSESEDESEEGPTESEAEGDAEPPAEPEPDEPAPETAETTEADAPPDTTEPVAEPRRRRGRSDASPSE